MESFYRLLNGYITEIFLIEFKEYYVVFIGVDISNIEDGKF